MKTSHFRHFRATLNVAYNVTERLSVDIGIHFIVHKLTTNSSNKDDEDNNNDKSINTSAFSDQAKYFVVEESIDLFSQ